MSVDFIIESIATSETTNIFNQDAPYMQLSKIKMGGFKSFVDPTTIMLPSHLVAIVGPNGCGKSNIIDAVTWVMGESSPKYLRGEVLTDVIFNGSQSRKPVGQAFVELVFDNSDGKIKGEYGQYAEISIKRMINRDSDSTYYLNGARCRKRDVADLFHGTGLGARSYSIIGQNMIARFVEGKPDEQRSHLEEAAGISKYKERRRETELRIGQTKENILRIQDISVEQEKQLSHLKHQANVAEKYKTLKQQERIMRAELYGIQWRHLDGLMVNQTLQIQRVETALEANHSALLTADHELEHLRHEQRVTQDGFQEIQRRYYAVGNEITRIEQDILHHQERQQQWENDLAQTESAGQTVKDELSETDDEINELERSLQALEPELVAKRKIIKSTQADFDKVDKASSQWQTQWDEFNQTNARTAQKAQVEKNTIEHLENKITGLKKRQAALQQDENRFNFVALDQEIDELTEQLNLAIQQVEDKTQALADVRKEMSESQSTLLHCNTQLNTVQSELQQLLGKQASLEALQQTALGERDHKTTPWLSKHDLGKKPRLAKNIDVQKGWEQAVEQVLGFCLQAVCLDDMTPLISHLNDFKKGNLCLFLSGNEVQAQPAKASNLKAELLLNKVSSPWPLDSLLSGIYVAESLQAALALAQTLDVHESVITADGIWLNRSWLKMLREDNPAAGIFEREQELKQLNIEVEKYHQARNELEQKRAKQLEQIKHLEESRDVLQQEYNQLSSQSAKLSTQKKMKQERLTELKQQFKRLGQEKEECENQLQHSEQEWKTTRNRWQEAMTQLEDHAKKREGLIEERERVRKEVQQLRDALNHQKDEIHSLEIRVQTSKSQQTSLKQNIIRLQTQLSQLSERKMSLQSELSSMPPIDLIKKNLSRTLDKHVAIEVELNTARSSVDALQQEARNLEEKRHGIEREISKNRTTLEAYRLELQGWKVKADTFVEQMKETEFTLEAILQDLPQELSVEECQVKLEQVVQRINRLGPINLVAIEEYATCLERKQYLDKQLEDLQTGLSTLEQAVEKIDKETRIRFKETFDQVNARFQELFPAVFGGGKAYLELTSDNLLEAGITVMACPPGKRNSSIYLLSGGEKSLTAIALIFSIFYLNPAPFCLLDEVDAALDDANVVRFTDLVKLMSKNTQFLFISHNKDTIEIAKHLIGVTMNEPGVSRLVSVDVEKAINMAGA